MEHYDTLSTYVRKQLANERNKLDFSNFSEGDFIIIILSRLHKESHSFETKALNAVMFPFSQRILA